MSSNSLGEEIEALAAVFLQQRGLKLIEKNYHSRYGEIDLICRENASLVFVEVRYRSRSDFGGAAGSVSIAKQKKIARTALAYLQKHTKGDPPCRFDVIAVNSLKEIEWIKSAFDSPL